MNEEDFLPISALQHILFCERQCALIHLERAWEENTFTIQGQILHEKVDSGKDEKRSDLYVTRSLPIKSQQLKVSGKADVVEFRRTTKDTIHGIGLEKFGLTGLWLPRPVEYKRGKVKTGPYDNVQLCAQAICLEEAFNISLTEADLFYHQTRRRQIVLLDAELRQKTFETAERLHVLFREGKTPPAEPGEKCKACSLQNICLPWNPISHSSKYFQSLFDL